MSFLPPVKKRDCYVAAIGGSGPRRAAPISLEVEFIDARPVRGGGSSGQDWILKFAISREAPGYQYIDELDAAAFAATRENNAHWFKNNLTEAQLDDFWRPSIAGGGGAGGVFAVLYSQLRPPAIYADSGRIPEDAIDQATFEGLRRRTAVAVVEPQGLYFYPKRFGIRWMVRKLVFDDAAADLSAASLPDPEERAGIEQFWEGEVAAFEARLAAAAAGVREILAAAKSAEFPDKTWNETLETLRRQLLLEKNLTR